MITKNFNLTIGGEFMSALNYGMLPNDIFNKSSMNSAFGEPTVDTFDDFVKSIYELTFDGKVFWIEELSKDGNYHIFTTVSNAPYVNSLITWMTIKVVSK